MVIRQHAVIHQNQQPPAPAGRQRQALEPHCVLAAIVFTIAVGLVNIRQLVDIRKESPGEFRLAVTTALAVVVIGVENGILIAIGLSLLRHVRHSYRPHTMVLVPNEEGHWLPEPAQAGQLTAPGDFFAQGYPLAFT